MFWYSNSEVGYTYGATEIAYLDPVNDIELRTIEFSREKGP